MFQDYKKAYSDKGDRCKEKAQSTLTVDNIKRMHNFFVLPYCDASQFSRYVILNSF